jgi:hypothetical protein
MLAKLNVGTTAVLAALAVSLSTGTIIRAQSISFAGSYLQTFDGMGTTGTTAPTGWSVYDEAGTHDTFSYFQDPSSGAALAGVAPNLTAGALTLESTLTAGAATTQKGVGGYNFATNASDTNRALGTSPSGNAATILEAQFSNATGSAITNLSIGYDIRRFTTTTNNNNFSTSDPTASVEENPGYWLFYSLDNGATWTNVSSLNPTLSGPNGVIVPNSVGVTSVVGAPLALNGTWAAGSTLELAWLDDNAQGPSPDQLLGLDNVALTAIPEPSVTAAVLGGLALGAFMLRRRLSAGAA